MIARVWRGEVPVEKAEEYLEYMRFTGIKAYREVPGNQGVYILRRQREGQAEFLLVSFWDSIESVRRFAGPDADKAVYYPKDKEYLIELESRVRHYEVVQA